MMLIGVSIAVPDPAGTDLQDYRVGLGDRDASGIPTHITLVPPTKIDDDELGGVVEHLRAVAAEHHRFEIRLRGTGTFRPLSPVVFVNLVTGISECELLADAVRTGPLDVDVDFPYHPHVTVAHELPEPSLDRAFDDLAGFEAAFTVKGFWLYTYDDQPGWVPQQAFPLSA
ncbi:2'-5' RNA ligase family protein [Nocardioides mangrovicus]|uniref:2'-5' RNA ligase family protein n=1 Tax=Nocardioides mangrovicus TaxID=2478913 RepID=A0A3L8P4J5_9ACTN|nr:2'-5' RNA ligase family protein [Nocardioides mangrovicus]RLV50024.1 2'-5' RNA ligase family protein [Nocardioides mangrovicus]